MMKLEDAILITNEEYNSKTEVHESKFIGQTRMDHEGYYYMVWEINGVVYKTRNKI